MRYADAAILLGGWLLVGQRWANVDAWEEVFPRQPFQTQAACEDHLRAKATVVATRGWTETRCVTQRDFAHHPKSINGDFGDFAW